VLPVVPKVSSLCGLPQEIFEQLPAVFFYDKHQQHASLPPLPGRGFKTS
jgi:hypothetical protein